MMVWEDEVDQSASAVSHRLVDVPTMCHVMGTRLRFAAAPRVLAEPMKNRSYGPEVTDSACCWVLAVGPDFGWVSRARTPIGTPSPRGPACG